MYFLDISPSWTSISSHKTRKSVSNCKILREQFPLVSAAAVIIHKCQGSTFSNVCIDMDLSESPKYSKNPKKAKPFFQHAHYVAASRVKSLNGLHILNWNPDLIGVNKDVQDHLDYMHANHEVKLCYTPVYNCYKDLNFHF